MSIKDEVKRRLPRNGRPRRGEERVQCTRYSVNIPTKASRSIERIAASMGTNRHALTAALVVYGLDLLTEELNTKGELPNGIRMDG